MSDTRNELKNKTQKMVKKQALEQSASRPPVDHIERTKQQYSALGYPPYAWVRNQQAAPFTPLAKPLSDARVGLVASGGIYRKGQVAFHFKDDISVRVINRDTPNKELRTTHFAYDLTASREDPRVVFPLETLRDYAELGLIGEVSPRAFTFMGGIYSARKVKEKLAPEIADQLVRDSVDVALMVPV